MDFPGGIEGEGKENLFTCMGKYWPFGAKEDEYKEYEKLNFIK